MSEERKTRIYARGSAKQHTFQDGSTIINYSLDLNDPKLLEHAKSDGKGGNWIALTMGEKREVDQFGNSHANTINTFVPKPKEEREPAVKAEKDDLPF